MSYIRKGMANTLKHAEKYTKNTKKVCQKDFKRTFAPEWLESYVLYRS